MTPDDEDDWSLANFAKQIGEIPQSPQTSSLALAPKAEANPDNATTRGKQDVLVAGPYATEVVATRRPGEKQLRTPNEIANTIMAALRAIGDCPEWGFVVTVYGSNPWNAMLTIKPEAGGAMDHSLWRSRVQEIGVQLRNDFDVIQEPTASTPAAQHKLADSDTVSRTSSFGSENI